MAKHVVQVGINAFPGSPLRGCVNDIVDMHGILRSRFGMKPEEARVVLDARATTQGMNERLLWSVQGLRAGDGWLFDYSGHGSQMRDRGVQDELSDHMDEILCPVDLDWKSKVITDDDLANILKRVPKGVKAYVILDCCHSGSGTRDLRPPHEDGNPHPKPESYKADRHLVPPFDIEARSIDQDLTRRTFGRGVPALGTKVRRKGFLGSLFGIKAAPREVSVVPAMNHVLISGCRSTETSADAYINGRYNGALTWALVAALKEAAATAPVTAVFAAMVKKMKDRGFAQNPQLEGPAELLNRPFFG